MKYPMKLNVLLAFMVFLIASTRGLAAEPFAPGQSWIYKSRPGETASRVLVHHLDDYPKVGKVIHVTISGLPGRRDHGVAVDALCDHLGLDKSAYALPPE